MYSIRINLKVMEFFSSSNVVGGESGVHFLTTYDGKTMKWKFTLRDQAWLYNDQGIILFGSVADPFNIKYINSNEKNL